MKIKFFILSIAFMAIAFAGYSQGFHLGIKGGANLYKIDGRSFKEEFNTGYNAGLFAEINFSEAVGIQPELLWSQSVTKTSTEFENIYHTSINELEKVKLDYFSIPLLLNLRPSKLLTFQVGPQYGILLNKKDNLLQNGKNAFKSGDFSVLGGLQLNLGGVKVGGRYVVGLTNINDIDNQDKWKNQGWQLYLGLRII